MEKLKQGLYFIYKMYFASVFFLALLIHYPILYYYLNFPKNHKKGQKFFVYLSDLILALSFVWPRKSGKLENIRPEKPLIICCNHTSYLDIPMVHSVFRDQPFLILGKAELTKWPLLRLFFKHMHIPVNRGNSRESVRSLMKAREAFKNGWNILIFPEGTIPSHVPKMKAFKNGAFEMAIREKADILPLTFLDNWCRITEPENFKTQSLPGTARVVVHDIIKIENYGKEDVVKLKKKVFETIEKPFLRGEQE